MIVKIATIAQGPVVAPAAVDTQGCMVHAWISPEEAAVHLVQGCGDRRVEGGIETWKSIPKEGDKRGFRCHGRTNARP